MISSSVRKTSLLRIIRAVYGFFGILSRPSSGAARHSTIGFWTARIEKGGLELNLSAMKTISCMAVLLVGCWVFPASAE